MKLHYSPNLGRLAKCSSDNCAFDEHFDTETMKRMSPVQLRGFPKVLKNSYLGISVEPAALAPALNQLKSAMTPKLFQQITQKKRERDGADAFHLTVITPPEFRKLKAENRLAFPDKPFTLELLGVGTASNEKSQSWFAVARSVTLDHYRYSLGLPRHDFHVTLGFTVADVHGVPKNETTLV